MTTSNLRSFPEGFLWGTATASYQIEGAVAEDGRTPSIWDTFSKTPGRVTNGDNGDVACDHYHRYAEDLDLLADLGVKAYRFSIAWPRVHPNGGSVANAKGLDFYKRLVAGLLERNITPLPTMYHWDLPQALEDKGGWTNRDTVERFGEYVETIVGGLEGIDTWTTFNEPWCAAWLGYGYGVHAPGHNDIGAAVAATHHLLLAHGVGVDIARSLQPDIKIGLTLNLGAFRPGSNDQADLDALWRVDGNQNRIWLDPLFKGEYPQDMVDLYSDTTPAFTVVKDGDLEKISTPIDFLGVNFYSPGTIFGAGRHKEAREAGFNLGPIPADAKPDHLRALGVETPGRPKTAMGWEVDASGLRELLNRVKNDYTDIPIYVTENGAAYYDYVDANGAVQDPERIQYLAEHLDACVGAIEDGVNLAGYFVWSLLDNFEWAFGYSRRFGIVWIDYDTGRRIPKSSFSWYRDVIKNNAVPTQA